MADTPASTAASGSLEQAIGAILEWFQSYLGGADRELLLETANSRGERVDPHRSDRVDVPLLVLRRVH